MNSEPRIWKDGRSPFIIHNSSFTLHRFLFVLVFALLAAQGPGRAAQATAPAPLDLAYHLRLTRPTSHLIEVVIVAEQVEAPALDFVMPAWAPGRYAIYNFAKNVQEFAAAGAQGQSLPWMKLDKQTWRIDTRQAGGKVSARYRVFANDLTGSFSQFDATHANLNGASVFMYIEGHKPDPLTLTVDTPANWKIISGFSASTDERSFHVLNYDRLVDTPLEISPECVLSEFQEQGKSVRVAVHSYGEEDKDQSKLVEALKKLVHAEMAGMPTPDFQQYTFLIHFAPDVALGDGMEHLNSTQIIVRGDLQSGWKEAIEDAAHEFFHLWNVKRLRPEALGPFDYTRENYTRSLWFAEGLTSYFAYIYLLRSGFWSQQEFLGRLAEEVRSLEQEPGRALMSAESSSFNAWFYDRAPQMQETNFANATISYYNKGALLGLLLDLEIRSRTQGQKSLREVLAEMYHKFYEAPATSYYGPGHGYTENDVLEAINGVTGADFRSFFERYVEGSEPLPYAETLKLAGLELRTSVTPGSAPTIGALVQPDNRGEKIVSVLPGGAADRAGLSRDDLLVSVDDQSLATQELRDRLKIYPPGKAVPFMVERHGRREIISVVLDPPIPDIYEIKERADATPSEVEIRKGWLKTNDER
jgi:predicted metalloprotease with PDZ domain